MKPSGINTKLQAVRSELAVANPNPGDEIRYGQLKHVDSMGAQDAESAIRLRFLEGVRFHSNAHGQVEPFARPIDPQPPEWKLLRRFGQRFRFPRGG